MSRKDDYGAQRNVTALLATLRELSDDDVLRILTFLVAETLPAHIALVEVLGAEFETDMAKSWTPDDVFFDLLRSKDAINAVVAEVAGEEAAAAHVTSTAKVQKDVIKGALCGARACKMEN